MTNFSFSATAGASQSTVKTRLAGNEIHEVTFAGVAKNSFDSKKTGETYEVITLTFENKDGVYEHTVFGPRAEDFERKEQEYKDKKTDEMRTIPQPSNVESMMLLFKHAIDTINPKIASAIDSGTKNLAAADWDGIRDIVLQILTPGIGKIHTKIKLIKDKTGQGRFPGFFAAVNKEGQCYLRNNFIGEQVSFTPYEVTRMNNMATATPTDMTAASNDNLLLEGTSADINSDPLDLNFDVK